MWGEGIDVERYEQWLEAHIEDAIAERAGAEHEIETELLLRAEAEGA